MRDTVREEKKDIIEQIAELGKADRNMLDVAKAYLEGLRAGVAIGADSAIKKKEEEARLTSL